MAHERGLVFLSEILLELKENGELSEDLIQKVQGILVWRETTIGHPSPQTSAVTEYSLSGTHRLLLSL